MSQREVAVNKDRSSPNSSVALEAVAAERVVDLLSRFSSLHHSNQHLLNEMRGTIDELRELKGRLLSRNSQPYEPDRGTSPEELGKKFGLTRREAEVAVLLVLGRSNQAIARELKISSHTARHHTQRVLSKLEVHSRAEAGAKLRG
jgi:DNA-binding NarL/FixJ family response regulator